MLLVGCFRPDKQTTVACEEPTNGDKASLGIFWLKDELIEESANLPATDVIAADFDAARNWVYHCRSVILSCRGVCRHERSVDCGISGGS